MSGAYEFLLKLQGGVCNICQCPPTRGRRLDVDHDHLTGVVRGLLCSICNRSLGTIGKTPEILARATQHLAGRPLLNWSYLTQ